MLRPAAMADDERGRINGKIATRVPITGVWLRRIGNEIQVLVELEAKEWRLAITEQADGQFSHVADGNGADGWRPDPLTVS